MKLSTKHRVVAIIGIATTLAFKFIMVYVYGAPIIGIMSWTAPALSIMFVLFAIIFLIGINLEKEGY